MKLPYWEQVEEGATEWKVWSRWLDFSLISFQILPVTQFYLCCHGMKSKWPTLKREEQISPSSVLSAKTNIIKFHFPQ